MAKVDFKIDFLKCLVHDDKPAVFLCLNHQCQNGMRLCCQQCLGDGDNLWKNVCLSQHLEDTLEVDSWSINKCYEKMQSQFMLQEEVDMRIIMNINQIRLEKLGRDTYRYLQARAFREVPRVVQSNQAQWSQEFLENFLQSQTSRYMLKDGVDALLKSSSSEIAGNMEIEGGFEQLLEVKKQQQKAKLEAFKRCLDAMKNNLSRCQDILSQQDTLIDRILQSEADELFEQIKKVIENFISKRTICRNNLDSDSTPNEPDRVGPTTRGSQVKANPSKIEDESDEESNEDEEYKANTNNNKKKKQTKKEKKKKNKKTKKIEQQHKSQVFADEEVRIEPLSSESQQKTNIFTKLLMKEMMQQQQSQNVLKENNENQHVEESISTTLQMQKQSPKEQLTQELREPQYQSQQTDLSQDSQQTQSLQLNSQLSELEQKQLQVESSNYQEKSLQNQLDSHDQLTLQGTIAQANLNQANRFRENQEQQLQQNQQTPLDVASQKQLEFKSSALNNSPNNLLETATSNTLPQNNKFFPKLEKLMQTFNVQGKKQDQQQSQSQEQTPTQYPQGQSPGNLALSEDLKEKIKKMQDSSSANTNQRKNLKLAEGQPASKNDFQQQQEPEKHLSPQSSPSISVSSLIHPIDTLSFPRDHKISRLILNANSTMMIAVCGGWQKSSGKAFLVDIDHTQKKVLKTKKIFSSPSSQFTDGVFSLCDSYVCLAAQSGIHIFPTSSDQPGEKQTPALLKIETNYSVRSLIINPARILKNEKIHYELILGGNLHFGIAHIEHTMKNPLILQDLSVKGQIECIDFIADNKYAVFAIFELQVLQCYDFAKNKIIATSKSLGFDPWSMQVNQLENQIYVAGEDEFIHLFEFNPLRSTIQSLRKIKLYHDDIIISFAFYQHLLFIATSDYAFQVLQQKDEKQLEYTPFYFTDDKDHLMPNLTVSAKHNSVYVASQLAKITSYQIS